jgi:formate dehydrogenase maturation protein FdhE
MRRIIENELCEYIAIFQSVGKPYLVEFHVELNQIETFQLSNLADQLINFGIDSLNREKTPFIYAEGKITKTIGPDRILKIYPV